MHLRKLLLYFLFVPICNSRPGSGGVGVGLWRRIPVGIHSFHKSLLSTCHARFCARNGSLALIPSNSASDPTSSHCRTIHIEDTNYMDVSGGISGDVLPFVGVMNGCGRQFAPYPTSIPLFVLAAGDPVLFRYFPADDSGEGSSDALAPALISSREMIVRFSGSLGVKHSHY